MGDAGGGDEHDRQLDPNAIDSDNLRFIRQRHGWTQADVAERLSRFTGHRLPNSSISAMERGFNGERRRHSTPTSSPARDVRGGRSECKVIIAVGSGWPRCG
jgi:hypothetical protein